MAKGDDRRKPARIGLGGHYLLPLFAPRRYSLSVIDWEAFFFSKSHFISAGYSASFSGLAAF